MADESGWDGQERRRLSPVVEAIKEAAEETRLRIDHTPMSRQDHMIRIVSVTWMSALLLIVIVSQFRLADRHADSEDKAVQFRRSVACFIVSRFPVDDDAAAAAAEPRGDILTRCGFITTPGNEEE